MKVIIFDRLTKYTCFIFSENSYIVITENDMTFNEICDYVDCLKVGKENITFLKLQNGLWEKNYL